MCKKHILLIETFYGGSHQQLMDLIVSLFSSTSDLFTMTAKKWHWRAISSPLHMANMIPKEHDYRVLFTSSVLPLAEFVALRPDLMKLYKIVYFHENQLAYPVQERKQRYFQHGYNDILTCLAADKVLFNSNFNKESFLGNITSFLNVMPDYKPKNLDQQIRNKSEVLYFPIDIQRELKNCDDFTLQWCEDTESHRKLHIVWPHRWEHDKDPETFFSVMHRLKETGEDFNVSVVGESFSEKPCIFADAKENLKDHIKYWGFQENKSDYFKILRGSDVVVSTAKHEFFGVSILEAIHFDCYPLCPRRLSYPELYPDKYLYNTPNQLFKKLKYFCRHPKAARAHKIEVHLERFSWEQMKIKYNKIFVEAMA